MFSPVILQFTAEQWGQLLSAIVAVLTALVPLLAAMTYYIKSQIDKNTKVSAAARDAAQDASHTVDAIQVATVNNLRYQELERWYAAVQTLEGCEGCLKALEAFKDRRRVRYELAANLPRPPAAPEHTDDAG